MKKILLAFDGTNFSEGAFEFARRINEKDTILLTGVFLPLVSYFSLRSYAFNEGGPPMPLIEEQQFAGVKKNIERFKTRCQNNNIEYRVHEDFDDFALPELKKETRFADLVILGSESFYNTVGIGKPNEFLEDVLHGAQCPIVVIPEKYGFPENNILAYDGSDSSIYAIKQFAYLFPELCTNDTLLIHLEDGEQPIPDLAYIEELASRHYPNLTILKLELPSAQYFSLWANERKNAMLICGAYGRTSLSQMFKRSFVADIIKDQKLPIFMVHR